MSRTRYAGEQYGQCRCIMITRILRIRSKYSDSSRKTNIYPMSSPREGGAKLK